MADLLAGGEFGLESFDVSEMLRVGPPPSSDRTVRRARA
jgi:hypothetical protein